MAVGSVFSYLGAIRVERAGLERDRQARRADDEVQDARRRAAFRRETLAGAQEGLLELWRASGNFCGARAAALAAGQGRLDEIEHAPLFKAVEDARVLLPVFVERLHDDQIRTDIWEAAVAFQKAFEASSPEEAAAALAATGPLVMTCVRALGVALREAQ